MVECFCDLHGCPFIIFNSPIYYCIVIAQHEIVTRSCVPLKLAILGVILYMKKHPTLYWCYTVKSLLINNELVQTTCQLPIAHRACYHICCFEIIYITFVFLCLLFFPPWFTSQPAVFPHPTSTLNLPQTCSQISNG